MLEHKLIHRNDKSTLQQVKKQANTHTKEVVMALSADKTWTVSPLCVKSEGKSDETLKRHRTGGEQINKNPTSFHFRFCWYSSHAVVIECFTFHKRSSTPGMIGCFRYRVRTAFPPLNTTRFKPESPVSKQQSSDLSSSMRFLCSNLQLNVAVCVVKNVNMFGTRNVITTQAWLGSDVTIAAVSQWHLTGSVWACCPMTSARQSPLSPALSLNLIFHLPGVADHANVLKEAPKHRSLLCYWIPNTVVKKKKKKERSQTLTYTEISKILIVV